MTYRPDVVNAAVEVCGMPETELVDGVTLETLEIDSLDLIEVAMILEAKHDVTINADDFEDVVTFDDAVLVFDRIIGEASGE